MRLTPTEQRLHRVTELTSDKIRLLREGVSIEAALSRTLSDTLNQVVADRLHLAESFLDIAERLRRSRSDMARASIARYYYAMYHAMRAVSYHHHEGDDHEAHSTLFQKGIPHDFPNAGNARNDLKEARLLRNEADYDPYPAAPSYFKGVMRQLAPVSRDFVSDARNYLASKGNPYL